MEGVRLHEGEKTEEGVWAEAMVLYVSRNKEHLDKTGSLEILVPEDFLTRDKLLTLQASLEKGLLNMASEIGFKVGLIEDEKNPKNKAFLITKTIDVTV
jgi:hypothetical protein